MAELLATGYRVRTWGNGRVILTITALGGQAYDFVLPIAGLRGMNRQIKAILDQPSSRAVPEMKVEPVRYLTEPGPNGGWTIAMTDETPPRMSLALRSPEGLEVAMNVLADEGAELIRDLSEVLTKLSVATSSAKN